VKPRKITTIKEELEIRKKLLRDEQVALVTILDTLAPFDRDSQAKLVKSVKEFFGLYIGE
jgi:hypothetical protein